MPAATITSNMRTFFEFVRASIFDLSVITCNPEKNDANIFSFVLVGVHVESSHVQQPYS